MRLNVAADLMETAATDSLEWSQFDPRLKYTGFMELAERVWKLKEIVMKFLADNKGWKWEPKLIKYEDGKDIAGIYLLQRSNGTFKVGMSHHLVQRINKQRCKNAILLMTMDECIDLCPNLLVDIIIKLQLPCLFFDSDHRERRRITVWLQLAEALAGYYLAKDGSHPIFLERLTTLPSLRVMETMEPPDIKKEVLKEFKYDGVHIVGTWITLPSQMRDTMESDYLLNKLNPKPRDAAGFVKMNRWVNLFDLAYGTFEDCLTKSPRSDDLDKIVKKLTDTSQRN